ncbi:transcription/translation regulatory transformer protein RfaH [Shewanella xiamenensis]|uniref:transcription/translation regulatory transformer protein RfaH n=1 Tax=Shewanella xiamenensis TaxID=332186 RepID=UPI0021C0AA59|nr:transcription/translation regulatory transformer protein RfaH [Shewanella xiamenensis]MCT8867522.1 transcription/translation regulatory transformer protein RfaH [Shewanella xiamenensis]
MKAWYLLYCKPRSEARAQQNLALQNLETYLPMVSEEKSQRGQKRICRVPLFPNYLFINFDPSQTSVKQVHSTRGVSRIVNCQERMTPIDERVIHAIRMKELTPSQFVLDTPLELKTGEKIRFKDGPFADLEAIFQEKCPNKRCHVLFNIMGQINMLTVPEQSVERV